MDTDRAVLVAAPVLAVAALAALAGRDWALVVLGAVVLGGVALWAVARPVVAAAGMVVAEVTNVSGVVGAVGPVGLVHAVLGIGVLALANALRAEEARRRIRPVAAVCAALLLAHLAGQLPGLAASLAPAESAEYTLRLVLDTVFLLVLLLLVQATARPWVAAAAIVLPLAALSVAALVNEVLLGNAATFGGFATVTEADGVLVTTARHAGPLTDSNFWGRHLVVGLPFALALIHRAWTANRLPAVLGWLAATGALAAGTYLTQSRGTLLAAAVAVAVWVVASGPPVRRAALVVLPLTAPLLLLPGIGDRLVDMAGDLVAGERFGVDPSILGRQAAQEVAWAIFHDHPLFGAGPQVYASLAETYAGRVGTAVLRPTDGAHNLYAQIAAESGVVGLLGWSVLVLGFVALAVLGTLRLAGSASRGVGGAPSRSLAAAGLAALAGWSAASLFLHMSYYRTFGLCLVMIGAVAAIALSGEAGRPAVAGAAPAAEAGLRRGAGYTAVCGAVGACVALVVLAAGTGTTHLARQTFTLQPAAAVEEAYLGIYALDIRSREPVVPTYALILQGGRPDVRAEADPVRGTITLVVAAADPAAARTGLEEAVAAGRALIGSTGAGRSFELVPMSDPALSAEQRAGTGAVAAAALAGASAAAATFLLLRAAGFLALGRPTTTTGAGTRRTPAQV